MAYAEGCFILRRIDPVERHLLLEGVFMRYGYDFRQYSQAALDRRLLSILSDDEGSTLIDVLKRALTSAEYFRKILPHLTINTTEFFRDPAFFRSLREQVFPVLKTYPTLTVWSAGCSTGEEVVSLCIALREEGLYDRTTIHATDINPTVLQRAREGIFSNESIQGFAKNYAAAGGQKSPSEYYTADYGLARFDPTLFSNVVFSEHNLATDGAFVEAHLVLCRNVLIYFTKDLQNRALELFAKSLVYRGFLGIGSKESLQFSSVADRFEVVNNPQRVYRLNVRPAGR